MPWMRTGTVDVPFGAIPYGRTRSLNYYRKDSSAAAMYPGDFVIMEADGNIAVSATDSTNIIGVSAAYSAASTADDVPIYDDPDQMFVIQDDATVDHIVEADLGNNYTIITTTGNTTTLRSAHELDSSSEATTTNLPLKLLFQHPAEGRSFATATNTWRRWVVKINNHFLSAPQQAGI